MSANPVSLSMLPGLALAGVMLATSAVQAAPMPVSPDRIGHERTMELIGDRGGAVAAGILGGVLGLMAGSALSQPRYYAPPPVYYAPPSPAIYAPPPVVYAAPPSPVVEEECVVRRVRVYDPAYGWVLRHQRSCY